MARSRSREDDPEDEMERVGLGAFAGTVKLRGWKLATARVELVLQQCPVLSLTRFNSPFVVIFRRRWWRRVATPVHDFLHAPGAQNGSHEPGCAEELIVPLR